MSDLENQEADAAAPSVSPRTALNIVKTDRTVYVPVGDGAQMTLPRPEWLYQLCHVRKEPPRGTLCDDRMLTVGVMQSYLYLVEECTKEEAWRRIKILRAAMKDVRGENKQYGVQS